MKMLGQDLHTQQEFDEFHKNEFTPIVNQTAVAVAKAEQAAQDARRAGIAALLALIVSVGSIVVTLLVTAPK